MKRALLFALLSVPAVVVGAQELTQVVSKTGVPSFLSTRGLISSQELVEDLNAKLTPQQRTKLDQALEKRNAALTKANENLSETLRDILGETDEGLTRRIDDEAEAKRMDRMRRLQPGRYQQLMKNKKKAEQKETPSESKPQ
ncbi:hypothetical protein EON83_21880 [bacterium]|nr:MAG: hypothetical protein EON83_21880 [bacterium]